MFEILDGFFLSTFGKVFSEIGMGFFTRIFILGVLFSVFNFKTITLPPIVGVITILHYWLYSDYYSDYDFITPMFVLGLMSLELLSIAVKGKDYVNNSSNVSST